MTYQNRLAASGIWNYLREEITVALEVRRPVRIGRTFDHLSKKSLEDKSDDERANAITALLVDVLNLFFEIRSQSHSLEYYESPLATLRTALMAWKRSLPPTFVPFSTAPKAGNVFPSLWMKRPWHGEYLHQFPLDSL